MRCVHVTVPSICPVIFLQLALNCPNTTAEIIVGPASSTKSITTTWTSRVKDFMNLFGHCKVQILIPNLEESDEALALADFFGAKAQGAMLVHPIYNSTGHSNPILFPVRYKPSSFRSEYLERWRYTNCFTQIYTETLLNRPWGPVTHLKALDSILGAMKENPRYIILLVTNPRFIDGPNYARFLPPLHVISIPSTYIIIRNRKEIDTLCLACIQEGGYGLGWSQSSVHPVVPLTESVTSLEGVTQMWKGLNYNDLHSGFVSWVGGRLGVRCNPLKDRLLFPPHECAMAMLEKKFNFTTVTHDFVIRILIPTRRTQFIFSTLYMDQYLSPDVINFARNHDNFGGYELSSLGGLTYSYTPVFVMDVRNINISAFWRSFDLPTWFCTVIGAFLSAVTLLLVSARELRPRAILHAYSLLLGFLIDRSLIPSRRSYTKIYIPAASLLFLWTQVAYMISSGYRGALFSLITSTRVPSVPQSMEELATNPEMLITNTAYACWPSRCSLHHAAMDSFLQVTATDPHDPTRQKVETFAKKLIFVNSTLPDIVFSQTEQGSEFQLQQGGNKTGIRLPANHVFIGNQFDSSIYMHLVTSIGKKLIVVKGTDIPLIMQHIPLRMKRNFFARPFASGLSRIFQSGLWNKWDQMYILHQNNITQYQFNALLRGNSLGSGSGGKTNSLAALFIGSEVALTSEARTKWGPLPFSVLETIFLMFSGLIVISTVSFVSEMILKSI